MSAKTYYAVRMDCPHATKPDLLLPVRLLEKVRDRWNWAECLEDLHANRPYLWIPMLDTWTPDTLRMVLHELATYLPPHERTDELVAIRTQGKGGRQGRLDVWLSVEARGWRAELLPQLNDRSPRGGETLADAVHSTGKWSEPMVEMLQGLAKRSPFPLAAITRVRPADDPDLPPSRLLSATHQRRFSFTQPYAGSNDASVNLDVATLDIRHLIERLDPVKREVVAKLLRSVLRSEEHGDEEDDE